jgi:hypothetical protein
MYVQRLPEITMRHHPRPFMVNKTGYAMKSKLLLFYQELLVPTS